MNEDGFGRRVEEMVKGLQEKIPLL